MMKRVNIFGSVLTAIAALVFVACNSNDELDELRNGETADNISRAADNEEQEEPQLVKVTYRKDWYWTPAYANLMAAYHPIVYRDRTYETGETFTDTFQDYSHIGSLSASVGPYEAVIGGAITNEWTGTYVYSPQIRIADDDKVEYSKCYASGRTGVPNLSIVNHEGYVSKDPQLKWSQYRASHLYDDLYLDVDLTGVEVIGSNGTSSNATGWYMYAQDPEIDHHFPDPYGYGVRTEIFGMFYDQYLVIDGQMITFIEPEIRGTIRHTLSERDVTLANGAPAKIIKHEGRTTFYGRDYYASVTDTIYQMSEAEIQAYSTQTAAQASAPANSMFSNIPASIVDDGQPKFIYGGKPKGRKGMF